MLEEELGCRLERVTADRGRRFPDYRTPGGDRVIEVKWITSEDFRALGAAFDKEVTEVEDRRLTGRWTVPVQRPDLSTVLPASGQMSVFANRHVHPAQEPCRRAGRAVRRARETWPVAAPTPIAGSTDGCRAG